jgi:hypothetical protein
MKNRDKIKKLKSSRNSLQSGMSRLCCHVLKGVAGLGMARKGEAWLLKNEQETLTKE